MITQNSYRDRTVLITGGTGSFGRTVTEQLLGADVGQVRVFSRDEAKQDQMRHDLGDSRLRFYVGDVRDFDSVSRAARDVDFIFHAAALKQVPSCEFFPLEAVRTNILGSENVIRAADYHEVSSVVFLSTDKAVYPVNAMGMSKAMMEKVAHSHGLNNPDTATTASCVRYGNVMYSRGSVIPLFVNQIRQGKNLTVTDGEMTRFMMSLAESVDLVDFAFHHASQGDIFIKKARASTITDLAQALINLFRADVGIEVIGQRHAEKTFETLATMEELSRAEDAGDFFRIRPDNRDLNYKIYVEEGRKERRWYEDYHSHNVTRMSVEEVEQLLLTLPEIRRELAAAGLAETLAA